MSDRKNLGLKSDATSVGSIPHQGFQILDAEEILRDGDMDPDVLEAMGTERLEKFYNRLEDRATLLTKIGKRVEG